MKQNKYEYLKVLQGMFNGKWEDLTYYEESDNSIREDYKAYKENDPRPYRIIHRRELRT